MKKRKEKQRLPWQIMHNNCKMFHMNAANANAENEQQNQMEKEQKPKT